MQNYGYGLVAYPDYKVSSCSCSLLDYNQTAFCTYTCTKWESKYSQVGGDYYVYADYTAGEGDLT